MCTVETLLPEELQVIRDAAASKKYLDRPVPDELMLELPHDLANSVEIAGVSQVNLAALYPPGHDGLSALQDDWEVAREEGALYLYGDGRINFATHLRVRSGEAAEVSISRNVRALQGLPGCKPWFMNFVPAPDLIDRGPQRPRQDGTGLVGEQGTLPPLLSDAILGMKRSKDYLRGVVLEDELARISSHGGPLSSWAHVPEGWRRQLEEMAREPLDVIGLLDRDFKFALDQRVLRQYEGKLIFPISVLREDGRTPVEVSLKRSQGPEGGNAEEMRPWRLSYVDRYVPDGEPAGRALEGWAELGGWDQLLEELAGMALPETWDFEGGDGTGSRRAILRSYLCYSFYRLKSEGKVLENPERGLASFNTGLVDRLYEPIYACFHANDGILAWRFGGFCRSGAKGLGKQLVSAFNPLPQAASYFSRKEDLLFDMTQPLELDTDHILLDNIDRLPLGFLEDELGRDGTAASLLASIKDTEGLLQKNALYRELADVIRADARTLRRLMNRLDDAKELALKRVGWNFRTAVPAFYPRCDSMSLLLPLDLTEDGRPDVALVVEMTESGAYLGQTVLTMRMAYTDARLVSRPDSDWLSPRRA